jgi:hypothetical protein
MFKGRSGSLGDQIRTDQLLPLRDRKADVAYEEIIVRRSNWLDCPPTDPEADIAHGPCEWPLLADRSRSHR